MILYKYEIFKLITDAHIEGVKHTPYQMMCLEKNIIRETEEYYLLEDDTIVYKDMMNIVRNGESYYSLINDRMSAASAFHKYYEQQEIKASDVLASIHHLLIA